MAELALIALLVTSNPCFDTATQKFVPCAAIAHCHLDEFLIITADSEAICVKGRKADIEVK